MLSYRWVESSGGPPRKYFSLTEKGDAFYKELENTWKEMSEAVGRVIQPKTPEEIIEPQDLNTKSEE